MDAALVSLAFEAAVDLAAGLAADFAAALDVALAAGFGRAFGQKDPLIEYKNEAFQAFNELTEDIKDEIASTIFRVQLVKEPPAPPPPLVGRGQAGPPGRPGPNGGGAASQVPVPAGKIGRNDPCYCGSGKKYKKCHGR